MLENEVRKEYLIAAALLLLGFLILFPTVIINAPGMGSSSSLGRNLSFLFDARWEKYWSSAFIVVTLYGLILLEGILRRAGDQIYCRIGMVNFALAPTIWLITIVLDANGVRGGRDFENFFITLSFLAVAAYGLSILRTRILARWIGIIVVLWSIVMLIRVFPQNEGPLFYEPALVVIAVALLAASRRRTETIRNDR